jgi:hypothetical protein
MSNVYMRLFEEFRDSLRALKGEGAVYQDSINQMVILLLNERHALGTEITSRDEDITLDDLPTFKEIGHDGTGSDPDAG